MKAGPGRRGTCPDLRGAGINFFLDTSTSASVIDEMFVQSYADIPPKSPAQIDLVAIADLKCMPNPILEPTQLLLERPVCIFHEQ